MNSIKECFNIILNGDKASSRSAARRVRKILYSSQGDNDKFKEIKDIINNAPVEYAKISEEWRQENFVLAVSVIYFLHEKEERPDFLFSWFFQLLQHYNGVIRYAAVKMLENELGPLTVYIRCPDYKIDKLNPEQADIILRSLYVNLNDLLSYLWLPKYKRYKYIDSLPASSYKSAQMVLARMEDLCGKKYMDNLARSLNVIQKNKEGL